MTFSTGLVTATAAILNQTAAQATTNALATATTPIQNQYAACGGNSGPSGSLAVPVQGTNENPAGRMGDVAPQGLCNLYNALSGGSNPLDANTVYAGSFAGSVVQACGAGYTYRL